MEIALFSAIGLLFLVALAVFGSQLLRNDNPPLPGELSSSRTAPVERGAADARLAPADPEPRKPVAAPEAKPDPSPEMDETAEAVTSPEEEPPSAAHLLSLAGYAAERLTDVSFDFEAWGTGAATDWVPRFRGHVKMRLFVRDGEPYFSLIGEMDALPGQARGPYRFRLYDSRQTVVLVDDSHRRIQTFAPGALPVFASLDAVLSFSNKLLERDPFREEKLAVRATHSGVAAVDEVECDRIDVQHPPARHERLDRWYLGRDDSLPRGFDRSVPTAGPDFGVALRIRNLDAETPIESTAMQVERPQGYAEDRDGAPFWWTLPAGSFAPDWELAPAFPETEEETIRSMALRGDILVLDFRDYCGEVSRAFQDLALELYDAPLSVLGIHTVRGAPTHRPPRPANECIAELGFSYPVLVDGEDAARAFNLHNTGLPAFYVVDETGRVLHSGQTPDTLELIEVVERRLREMERHAEAESAREGGIEPGPSPQLPTLDEEPGPRDRREPPAPKDGREGPGKGGTPKPRKEGKPGGQKIPPGQTPPKPPGKPPGSPPGNR